MNSQMWLFFAKKNSNNDDFSHFYHRKIRNHSISTKKKIIINQNHLIQCYRTVCRDKS